VVEDGEGVAMKRLVALVIVAACSAPPERVPEPPRVEAPPDAAPPPPELVVDREPPPTPCGDMSWTQCFTEGNRLLQEEVPDEIASGVVLLRALCEEGDRRRCFEIDTRDTLKSECQRRMMVSACASLAQIYAEGVMTCPYDTACAAALRNMACLGGAADPACP
jgi:hypothetical protein